MNDEFPAHIAFVRAWGTYLAINLTVSENDARRFALERYLKKRCQAGQRDPDALTTAGLSYLRRHDVLSGSRQTPLELKLATQAAEIGSRPHQRR